MASPIPFLVKRKETELIVPSNPTPPEIKQLSDIDNQRCPRSHFSMIMFYQNDLSRNGRDPVVTIREAVAEALVYYYPYAGRLIEGPNSKFKVDCTSSEGKGVLFIEAGANGRLEQLGDPIQSPCSYSEELLFDVHGNGGIFGPLLLIQGASSSPSVLPLWKRVLLTARNPPRITCIHHEYEEVEGNIASLPTMDDDNDKLVYKSFFVGPREMKAIRKHLPPNIPSCSSNNCMKLS